MTNDDLPPITLRVLNIEFPWERGKPACFESQAVASEDVLGQFADQVRAALAEGDLKKAIRLAIRAEAILGEYCSTGFNLLAPALADFGQSLDRMHRMIRRELIRHVLVAPAEDVPALLEVLGSE